MCSVITLVGIAAYVGIAARVARVAYEVERRTGLHRFFAATVVATIWPFAALVLGFGTLLTGNSGIYDTANIVRRRP